MNRPYLFLLVSFVLIFASCSVNRLTEEEAVIVEKYTKEKPHDKLLIGEWINQETWEYKGTINREDISFDASGHNKKRMYRDGEAFNNWHLWFYYHTSNDTIFFYRPAEKGFMAMDDEIYMSEVYEISDDGKTLRLGDKTYTKRKL